MECWLLRAERILLRVVLLSRRYFLLISAIAAAVDRNAPGCKPARTIALRTWTCSTPEPEFASILDVFVSRRSPIHWWRLFAYRFLFPPHSPCASSKPALPRYHRVWVPTHALDWLGSWQV